MFKKMFLFLIVLATNAMMTYGQIEVLTTLPSDYYISLSHPENNIVYIAGCNNVYKSFDSGDTWQICYTFDSCFATRFFGLFFLNEQTGIATASPNGKNLWRYGVWDMTGKPNLYRTDDGGVSWQCIDSLHNFVNVRMVSTDTLFAIESNEGNLYKSVDGGHSWFVILNEGHICDYSIVNNRFLYALHGSLGYFDAPSPIVYKSSDSGMTWITIFPNRTCSDQNPKCVDQVYFYEEGKGFVYGHHQMYTENDFTSYVLSETGFTSAPDEWDIQSRCLHNGLQMASSWISREVNGYGRVSVSRDYGRHHAFVSPPNHLYFTNICDLATCDEDSVFYLITMDEAYRYRGSSFPSVEVVEHSMPKTKIFPQPIADKFYVTSDIPFYKIEIYNDEGKLVLIQDCNNQENVEISTTMLKSGFYVIKIISDTQIIYNKIIKL